MTNTLFQAVKDCRYLQAKFLIESGVDVNSTNKNGENLLIAALTGIRDNKKRLQMIKWLLRLGVDVTYQDRRYQRDCLMWAVVLDRTEEVEFILKEKEVDLNLRNVDKFGRCVVHYATLNKNEAILVMFVRIFKKYRINVDIRDPYNITPYIISNKLGHHGCASILLHEGGASKTQMIEKFFDSTHLLDGISLQKQQRSVPYSPRLIKSKSAILKVPSIVFSDDGDECLSTRSEPQIKLPNLHKAKTFVANTQTFNRNKANGKKFEIMCTRPSTQQTQSFLADRPDISKSYQITVMPAVYHMLSQQYSENYLPPVKKPEPPKEVVQEGQNKRISLSTLGKVTTFAVLLKNRAKNMYTPMESDEVNA